VSAVDWIASAGKFFLEPTWLYALLLLIPFILLYLIRPKPKQRVIPTLMFLFKDMGRDRKMTFFRRLIQDLLFILQFFALLFILVSVAKPYVNVSKESLFKNTVLVVDVSASMKAEYKGETRFEDAVELAKDNLGLINTVVLAKKTPEVALIDASSGEVRNYLDKLEPTDTPTNLYEAISTAGGYAKGDARVVVISDFIDTETDTDLETAKKTLEAQGIKVDFIRLFEPVPNIGIVDLIIDNEKTSAVIKNYNDEAVEAELKINSLEETLSIPANSQELFTFSTPPGTSKLELDTPGAKDGFSVDNAAFISAPADIKKKILLITNNPNPKKTFLFNAFDVMKNTVIDVAVPPKIPDLEGYDIYVFKDLNPNLILPGTFTGVKKMVEEKGKAAIIAVQTQPVGFLSLDYYGLMPLRCNETITFTTNIIPGTSESFTANVEFGITKKYFRTSPIEGKNVIIIAADDANVPLITFSTLGKGKIFFYGILDEDKEADAGFAKSPVYFVFWKRIVDFATNTPSIKTLNYNTGSVLNFNEEQNIQTPKGRISTKSLNLDNAGLYTLNDRVIAINLLDEKESDVSKEGGQNNQGFTQSSEKFKEKIPYELVDYLIILAIILLLLEFIYIKLRGDL
jgi:hypothetical protein